jgi:hypothetical protein
MKSINILLIFLLFSAFSIQAATLVVNNESSNPGQYTTIDAAIAAASANDIILVKGTATVYGGCTVDKPLTIVGNGYNPQTASTYPSSLGSDYFYIATGVHNVNIRGFNCAGVYLYSDNDHINVEFCRFNGYCYLNGTTCDDLRFSNCIMTYLTGGGPTNVTIEHCIIGRGLNLGSNTTNLLVRNNVFINTDQNAAFGQTANAIIINNIFYDALLSGSSGYVGNCAFTSCVISQNVMYSSAGTFPVPANSTIALPNGNTGNTIASNTYDVDPNFRSYTAGAAAVPFAFSHDFRLNTGSPALTRGVGSTQIGIYAASFDFSMTGEPRIPAIRLFDITTPATNSGSGSSININLKASKARAN